MRVALIRHGSTAGNLLHRYVGARTDEPLTPEAECGLRAASGVLAERIGTPDALVTSGMLRCRQTAAALFPGAAQTHDARLREMDFGRFENRSYRELEHDAPYRAWVDGGCEAPVPGGEDPAAFRSRVRAAITELVARAAGEGALLLALVVHGGVIRAALSGNGGSPGLAGAASPGFFDVPAPSACCWVADAAPVAGPLPGTVPVLTRPRMIAYPYDAPAVSLGAGEEARP